MTDEIDRLRADLKSMTEYALKLDASNDDYQAELEALRKELAEVHAIIHGMQDGSLARDQMGIIERAEARIAELETVLVSLGMEERAERAEAECKRLRELATELADDLASEIEARYERVLDHPAMKMRYDRDMETVERARAALNPVGEKPSEP